MLPVLISHHFHLYPHSLDPIPLVVIKGGSLSALANFNIVYKGKVLDHSDTLFQACIIQQLIDSLYANKV